MNVIVLCSDTYRWDYVSAYTDASPVRTPNLDRLAAEGVLFEQAFGEGIPTLPARRVLYTGRRIFPFLWAPQKWDRVQLPGWHPLFYEDVTMAEWLEERGYVTGLFSDLPHQFKPGKNFQRGFTQFEWVRGQEMDYYRSGPRDGVDLQRFLPADAGKPHQDLTTQFLMNARDWQGEADWCSSRVLQKGIQFLHENEKQQPFFLWLECFSPHEPWYAPDELVEKYYGDGSYDDIEWIFPPGVTTAMNPQQLRRVRAHYAGLCELIDRWFGKLMETAAQLSMLDDTIIVFLSDHGTMMGERQQLHKGPDRLRNQCTQVPLIIRHPDTAAHRAKRVAAFVQHQDLMPTLLKLMGEDVPDRCTGEDLWPLVTGEAEALRDTAITTFGWYASVRTAEWNYQTPWVDPNWDKLPQRPQSLTPPQLYHLTKDPEELNDVAQDYPAICRELHQRLIDYAEKGRPVTRGSLDVSDAVYTDVPLYDQAAL